MIQIFNSIDALSGAMVDSIIDELKTAEDSGILPKILLSGGGTPAPVYKLLNETYVSKNEVHVGLVDERFVPNFSDFSNEKLLKSCFSNESFKVIGMVHDSENEHENLELASNAYQTFIDQTDIIILGMGPDGHIASIFPDDERSHIALISRNKEILPTRAPSEPKKRITCSLELIVNAKSIYLLFFGREKWNVFNENSKSLPIHKLMEKRNDVKLFYLEND